MRREEFLQAEPVSIRNSVTGEVARPGVSQLSL